MLKARSLVDRRMRQVVMTHEYTLPNEFLDSGLRGVLFSIIYILGGLLDLWLQVP